MTTKSSPRGLAVLSLLLLAGCGQSVEPRGPGRFDASGVSASLASVEAASAGAAWRSLRALGPATFVPGGVGRATADGYGIARALLAANRVGAASIRIPPALRGLTLVYDTTVGYHADSTLAGAPADGVRFIIYDPDPAGRPNPEAPIGHADLHDLGDPFSPALRLRLEVVVGQRTRLAYTIAAVGDDSTGHLMVSGYALDGDSRIELSARVAGAIRRATAAAQVEFAIRIPERQFAASAVLRHLDTAADSIGEIGMTVVQGMSQVGLVSRVTAERVSGGFQLNGLPLATVEGPRSQPVVRGVGGRDLTPEEYQALLAIHVVAGNDLAMFGDLMRPAAAVLGS